MPHVAPIKLLQDRSANITRQMRALSANAADADRDLTAEESKEYLKMETELSGVRLALFEEQAKLNRERREEGGVLGDENGDALDGLPSRRARPRVGGTYAQIFGPPRGGMQGWASAEEYFRVLDSGLHDPRFQAAQYEGVPSGGGYAVPEPVIMQLLDAALPDEIVRPRARIEPMTSDSKKIAGFETLDRSAGALYGGFTSSWTPEGATPAVKNAKLRMIELHSYKHFLLAEASNELLEDADGFEGRWTEAMIKATGFHWDRAFLFGTGAGQPSGALSPGNPSLIVVTKEAGQATATLVAANIYKMFARMPGGLLRDAVWLVNSDALPQLLGLTIIIKNVAGTENVGGGSIPLVDTGPNGELSMLTRPILVTEHAATLGAQSDISFCAFSQYVVGLRKGMSAQKSMEAGFKSDTSFVRTVSRVDGQSLWAGPLKPLQGATQSPFITLEARP